MVTRPRSYTDAITRKPAKDIKTLGANILSDLRMGFGCEEKTGDFMARTRRTRDAADEQAKRRRRKRKKPAKSARLILEEERAAKLAEERAEGQKNRKAFEKAQGERYARRRRLLMNI